MAQFRLVAGTHTEGGRTYKAGEVVVSDLPLCEMFKNKFELVFGTKSKKPSRLEEDTDEETEETTETPPKEEDVPPPKEDNFPNEFGNEVTEDFPGATEGSLRVFFNEATGLYTVVMAEKPSVPLSDVPLKTRKATLKCVTLNAVPM